MIKKIISKIKNNSLIMNSIILIIFTMAVKVLSLINRIIMTRLLKTDGISLYVLSIPSIMLFTSIGSFSLNVSMTKLVSENLGTKKYSLQSILKKGISISIISSLSSIILLLVLSRYISQELLHNTLTYYPIVISAPFILISSLNNLIKGYFNGLSKIGISSSASFIEELSRIITIVIIFFLIPVNDIKAGLICAIISMTLAELISLIYQCFFLKNVVSKNGDEISSKEIIQTSTPTLLTRLLGNFTYFLEPIIYTLALGFSGVDNDLIQYNYGIVNGYILPIISICSFFSMAISTVVLPKISKYYAIKKYSQVKYYTKKSIIICLIPGILISILLMLFCDKYMLLIYGVNEGYEIVEKMSFFFIFQYISSPIISILQGIGKSKFHFEISVLFSFFKIALIFVLSLIPSISFDSLILAIIATSSASTIINYYYMKKEINFTFNKVSLIKIITITIFPLLIGIILKQLLINYLISSIVVTLVFLIFVQITNILSIDDK